VRSTATLGSLWITRSQCYSHTHLPVGLTHHEQEQDGFFFFRRLMSVHYPTLNLSGSYIGCWYLIEDEDVLPRRKTHATRWGLNWVFGGFEPDIKVDGDWGILGMIYA